LPRAGDFQQVTLTFATDNIDFYSTYLVVQNLDNPHDLKTIRINHEVSSALQTIPPPPFLHTQKRLQLPYFFWPRQVVSKEKVLFGVLVNGKQTEQRVMDLGDVYYEQAYRDHSFIIVNQSDMALDFLVTLL